MQISGIISFAARPVGLWASSSLFLFINLRAPLTGCISCADLQFMLQNK